MDSSHTQKKKAVCLFVFSFYEQIHDIPND